MPMSRITEKIASSTGTIWLGSASRPMDAATAVRPSSSGRPAATSAPKATTRMTSVTGSDSTSARWKSSSKRSEMPLSTVASPKASMRTAGFCLADGGDGGLDLRDLRVGRGAVVVLGQLVADERGSPVLGDLALVALRERRGDVG